MANTSNATQQGDMGRSYGPRRTGHGRIRRVKTIRGLLAGVRILLHGFGFYVRRPKLMWLGVVPALIVGALYVVGLVTLLLTSVNIATWMTPFANDWDEGFILLLRYGVAAVLVIAACALGVLIFSALTLMIGGPLYEQISRGVDEELGAPKGAVELTIGQQISRAIGDGLTLAMTAVVLGIVVFLVGLIPVVGSVIGAIGASIVAGRAIAVEMTGPAADARGMSLAERRKLLASRRPISLGFGIACYLLFLIPGGAVIGTPAAFAGATMLIRELRGEVTRLGVPTS